MKTCEEKMEAAWPPKPPGSTKGKPMKKKETKSNRWLVDFGNVDELGRKTATVFSKDAPAKGQTIQLGKSANTRQRVAAVWPLEGNQPQLGDLVLP